MYIIATSCMTYNIIAYNTHSLTEIAAGDANTVYAMLMKVLKDYDPPIAKIIGICSDGASTMQGVHKGVCVQLAKYIRELRQVYISDIIAPDHTRHVDSIHDSKGAISCCYYVIVNCCSHLNCSSDKVLILTVSCFFLFLNFCHYDLLLVH